MAEQTKLGPIQELWLSMLEQHPERQMTSRLGVKRKEGYKACCLGEALLCLHRARKKRLPFDDAGFLCDGNRKNSGALSLSFSKLGLHSSTGTLTSRAVINNKMLYSLANMNDKGLSWPEIAAYIRANPENVFNKYV